VARGQRNPIGRGFQILSWMAAREGGPWGPREIARGVGMNASTVQRLLGLLEEEQLVRREEGGRYELGLEFLRLAWTVSSQRSLRELALPHMRELAEQSGETVVLNLYDATRKQACSIAVVESSEPVRYVFELYEWRDLHAGASGRAILAFLPEDERRAVIDRAPLEPLTERTITDPKQLEDVVAEVRDKGYALSVEERRTGGVGVAAPVFGPDGRVIADVGLAIPTQRFDAADEQRLAELVTAAAERITGALAG
jgi:IclR family transcriptional regulator, acetate operon repressor